MLDIIKGEEAADVGRWGNEGSRVRTVQNDAVLARSALRIVRHVESPRVLDFGRAKHYVFEGHLIDEGEHVVLAVEMENFKGELGEAQTVHVANTGRKLLWTHSQSFQESTLGKRNTLSASSCFVSRTY